MDNIETFMECLEAVGYDGPLLKKDLLENLIASGPKSEDFRELVCWLSNNIHVLFPTDENVISKAEFSEFMLELSALLKELGCPYKQLIAGPLSDRIQTKESRFLLFDFLICSLMAAKMCIYNESQKTNEEPVEEKCDRRTAIALEMITRDLGLGKPPENISTKDLFEKINKKLILSLDKIDKKLLGEPVLNLSQPFTKEEWSELEKMNQEIEKEYELRKEMLLTRLDVTVQSFLWSDKFKSKQDEIMKVYQNKLKEIEGLENELEKGSLAGLIAATTTSTAFEKVSNADVRKNTFNPKVQRHIIGQVPDRGGRAFEHDIPPPEMPSWQQNRTSGPQGTGGNARGGRGGRGGNFQNNRGRGGNFNQADRAGNANHSSGFNTGGGNKGYNQGDGNKAFQSSSGYNTNQSSSYNQSGNFSYDNKNSFSQNSGNYEQSSGSGYNRNFNQEQNYGNSNRGGGYSQSRIQGRGGGGGGYSSDRNVSGDNEGNKNEQNFSRGRSNYNRGRGSRY